MEFGWNALESIFSQAGLRKNMEEDKWEFTKGISTPPPVTPGSSKMTEETKVVSPNEQFTPIVNSEAADDIDKSSHQRKKKNRGKKKRGMSQDLSSSGIEKNEIHISWGIVDEILFDRSIGFDCVPTKGEYPLGLGNFVEICTSSVDELFSRRQYLECLAANQAELMSAQSVSKKKKTTPKKGSGNQRKDSFDHHGDHTNNGNITPEEMNSDELKQLMEAQVVGEADRIRKLSNLTLHNHSGGHHVASVSLTVLEEVNHDIVSIRNSREHIGCSCKSVKVDKMNVNQLKAKLHQYESQLPPDVGSIDKMKKADLMLHVKEFVKDCKQCMDNNCECVRLEIPCAYFACECMKGSAQDCHNSFGKDSFDVDRIDITRKQVLVEWKTRESAESTENPPADEAKSISVIPSTATRSSRRKHSE
jgi:hypothetical protein